MGKGMQPKAGYNQKLYDQNYDEIDWSSTRKKSNENNKATEWSIEIEKQREEIDDLPF
jgi:hypothetical protein